MSRKSSIPLIANPTRRKSSFRYYMSGSQGSQDNELPSVSRPANSSYFSQPQSQNSRQTLMPNDFMAGPSSSRSGRYGSNAALTRKRRSSSQEPPALDKRRTFDMAVFDQHNAAGLLLTPVRPNPSKSPGFSGLASTNRGSASSRRHSSKLHVIPINGQKTKDPRPINDKNFQSNAISKIQNFLRRCSPSMANIKLKPLSNSTLVQVFNAIYRELDPTTNVTNSDYADKISNIIKNLGYPSNISKSSFIAVGSGHGGVQILAMLSWLVDCVEILTTVDFEKSCFLTDNTDNKMHKGASLTILGMYSNAKAGEPELEQEEVDRMFFEAIGDDTPDVHAEMANQIESVKQEIDVMEKDPRKIEEDEKVQQLDIIEKRIHEIRQTIEEYKVSSGTLKAKINTEKESIKSLENDNKRYKDMSDELKDRIANQVLNSTERDNIIAQCKQHTEQIKSQNEHLEIVHRLIGNADLKISKLQLETRSLIHEINKIVLEHQLQEEYKWSHAPTHNNAKENMLETKAMWLKGIESMEHENDSYSQCLAKLLKDIEELNEAKSTLNNELQKLKKECDQLDSMIIDRQGQSQMNEQELKVKIELTQERCCKVKKELEAMPKLAEVQEMIDKINKDTQQAKEDLRLRKEFLEGYFFPKFLQMQAEFAEELTQRVTEPFKNISVKEAEKK